ncbi:ParB/RepB/Spo0J family partition protein [Roseivivax sediminis]|uniref:Chromosome segregation protein Spo0J, contains ParB-like nuclease domain n=1 Tax=Roseivivax sediminis TaxID=936889 RepID=A0A1I2CU82_9RHOB|nr:ParB N-terminal domain-containing protein [Roseivivax sediminis]SFE71886.1 Chromosome segregation protein Spo0J, contains ParB-like nuclease domain [Roseivivax sediminis]
MAKRKRLTPANPDYLGQADAGEGDAAPGPKAAFASAPSRAPIAEIARETSSAAALGELSRSMEEARAQGRMILALPLDQVAAEHLVRDRMGADDEDFAALIESLAARGQQTPVEVVDRGTDAAPRYGLISGWRRLAALRHLAEEGRGAGEVLAVVRAPRTASDAYVAMVEENEIRVGLSYYERARIAVKAVEEGVFETREEALRALFANVSRAKRSKIRSFTEIVVALDGVLVFPTALAERSGLELARRLAKDPDLASQIKVDLAAYPPANAAEELKRLAAPAVGQGMRTKHGRAGAQTEAKATAASDSADKSAAPVAPLRLETTYDPERREITVSGSGVSASLHAELERWLAVRLS